jgi:cytochrome c553
MRAQKNRRVLPVRAMLNQSFSRMTRFGLACVAMAFACAAGAAESGDPVAGKSKTAMCSGCHGIPGYKSVFPEVYSVPKLGSQQAAYIVKALQAYRSGERSHPTMRAIAGGLSDKDMADLAAYYASAAKNSPAK